MLQCTDKFEGSLVAEVLITIHPVYIECGLKVGVSPTSQMNVCAHSLNPTGYANDARLWLRDYIFLTMAAVHSKV